MSLDGFLGYDEAPITPSYKKPWGVRGRIAPLSVINQEDIDKTIIALISFYVPPPARILDPTCGVKDYQFKHNFWKGQTGYDLIQSDMLLGQAQVQGSVYRLPYKDASFKGIMFDPPFVPKMADDDTRTDDYGQMSDLSLSAVMSFYGETVFAEFERVLEPHGIAFIRGMDNYTKDGELLLFQNFTKHYSKNMKPIGFYIYRFWHEGILRQRRVKKVEVFTHSYFLVLQKNI
jgi:hypothetical protein